MQNDHTRLLHMRDAAREAIGFISAKQRSDLDNDRVLALALVKTIEIIGEAASKVSQPMRDATESIPWVAIVGMRNRLIHAYFDVDLNRVWDTVVDDLPPLLAALEQLLDAHD